jgi:superoxide dismutase, Fe-Mn family
MTRLTRRSFLRGASMTLALASASSYGPRTARAAVPFEQPPLPYPEAALEPTISARTVGLHYGKHHAGYFKNLNGLVEGTDFAAMTLEEVVKASAGKPDAQAIFNNAGQAWNHVLYWEQFDPAGARQPSGALAEMIDRDFGGSDALKESFVKTAGEVFGSGWAWLVVEDGQLSLVGTGNADNPLAHGQHALLGIDVWEHAYYLDYQNRRSEHVQAVLDNLVDWDFVAGRLAT